MRWCALALSMFAAAGAAAARPAAAWFPEPPSAAPEAPASLGQLEGRGPGPPGSAAHELAAAGALLRFAAPAGGAAEWVVYLAATPRGDALELGASVALASLLGVPGEVRLEAGAAGLAAPLEAPPVDAAPAPVPEPGSGALGLLGLALLGASCHLVGRWSGPPRA